MPSSAITYPNLVDHPLRAEAMKVTTDCELFVRFRVWDPSLLHYKDLDGAKVDLVRSDGVKVSGETGSDGKLWRIVNSQSANVPFVIEKVNELADGLTFHFEVVGDAAGGTLKRKTWYGSDRYPIDVWSTLDWEEPNGSVGTFRPTAASFGTAVDPVILSVGVAYSFKLKYFKDLKRHTFFPYGLKIATRVNGTIKSEQVTAFGQSVTGVIFETKPNDKIEFAMPLSIAGDSAIKQLALTARIDAHAPTTHFEIGKLLDQAINRLNNRTTEIYVGELKLSPSPFFSNATPPVLLSPSARRSNFIAAIFDEQLSAAANFFVGFCEQYRRFSNVIFRVAGVSPINGPGTGIIWQGVPGLSLRMNFTDPGGAGTIPVKNSVTGRYESTLLFQPDNIAMPRLTSVYHEMTHALMYWYYTEDSDNPTGGSHSYYQKIGPRLAYIEGLADFATLLFLSPGDTKYFTSAYNWRTLFSGPIANRPQEVKDSAGKSIETVLIGGVWTNVPLPSDVGFEIELAFSLALYALWVDLVRGVPGAGEQLYVIDDDDGGEITGAANAWIKLNRITTDANTYIWSAICQATGVTANETTFDVLKSVAEIAIAHAKWNAIKPTFETLSLKFPFKIIQLGGIAATFLSGAAGVSEFSVPAPISCAKGVTKTVTLAAAYVLPGSTATLVGAANSSVGVNFVSLDVAQLVINPKDVGTFDLRIVSSGQTCLIKQAIKVS